MYAEYKQNFEDEQRRSQGGQQRQLQEERSVNNDKMSASAGGKLKTVLLLGSTREGRFGLRVARFMKKQLEEANHTVDLFDPVEMPFTLLAKAWQQYTDKAAIPDWLAAAERKLREADAIVFVSAEYNHSIPPALSNMVDHFPLSSYAYKPSGIVCYSMGPYGGMRAAMQLRCMAGELGCISVSNIFGIPLVQTALDESGAPLNDFMLPGARTLIGQLDWHARAMKAHREAHGLPK